MPNVPIITEAPPQDVPSDAISCIGHPDTAAVVSGILGRKIPVQRISVHLTHGDALYVAQSVAGCRKECLAV